LATTLSWPPPRGKKAIASFKPLGDDATMRYLTALSIVAMCSVGGCSLTAPAKERDVLANGAKNRKIVDLTHDFDVGSPHWKGDPPMRRRTVYSIAKDGFQIEEYCHVGQWGTHLDPPAHFHAGLRTSDQISPAELILPLVVIDVHKNVEQNQDYVLTVDDIKAWEERHGAVPEGAFVAMRTDWLKRWGSAATMQNRDEHGTAHYPGWSIEALRYLYEVRKITASGHEMTDTDPGLAVSRDDYQLESYILAQNKYQIGLLANLDQAPEAGPTVIIGVPKMRHGSGFPVRVLAVVAE
jgi:kynurenine formamidase